MNSAMQTVSKSKTAIRAMCRAHWGKDWHKVHPVIKKARLVWAQGGVDPKLGKVVVREDGSYVV